MTVDFCWFYKLACVMVLVKFEKVFLALVLQTVSSFYTVNILCLGLQWRECFSKLEGGGGGGT